MPGAFLALGDGYLELSGAASLQYRRRMRCISLRIRAQDEINPFRCVAQIKMSRLAQAAGTQCSELTLGAAATLHVEFVHDHVPLHIGHAHMQDEEGSASTSESKEKPRNRTSTVNQPEFAVDQPANPRRLMIFQDPHRRDALEFFLHVFGELYWRQRLPDRHFADGRGLVAFKHGIVDAKWANVDRAWVACAHAAICRHINTGAHVFSIGRGGNATAARGGHVCVRDDHRRAGAKEDAGEDDE